MQFSGMCICDLGKPHMYENPPQEQQYLIHLIFLLVQQVEKA